MDVIEHIKKLFAYECKGYDWQNRLRETEQNPEYHAEGNVLIHTQMVVEELLRSSGYSKLEEKDKRVLLLAALLHDIAKPFCTKREGGRLTSNNHAKKGAQEARRLFYTCGFMEDVLGQLSFEERESVCSLIRYHGLPLFFMDRENCGREIIKASLEVNLLHLSMLATADVLGRRGKSRSVLQENVILFQEYCSELGCLTSPKIFPSDRARFLYFRQGEQYLHYEPHDEPRSTVVLMSGIPASGKDTYIKAHLQGLNVISLDDLREEFSIAPDEKQGVIIQEAKKRARAYLAEKRDFVWNATNVTRQLRSQLIDLFLDYGASVRVVYCEAPFETALTRNAARPKPVPRGVIREMVNKLDVPKVWEAESVMYRVFG